MLKREGTVKEIVNGDAIVCVKSIACEQGCVGCSASQDDEKAITIENDSDYKVGDSVSLEISESGMVTNGLVFYGVPTVVMLASASVASYVLKFGDVSTAVVSLLSVVVSLLSIKIYRPKKVSARKL